MFCPNCGSEENQNTQFCRVCGSDLSIVRTAIGSAESGSDSSGTRSEIAKAFATKIEGLKSAKELNQVTKEVLPKIEKFLESPAEKRLRRIRTGSLISLIGFGVAIGFTLAGIFGESELLRLAALGFVTFFIGIAFVLNGLFFSLPDQTQLQESEPAKMPKSLGGDRVTNDLLMPASARSEFGSVTENTTRTLNEKMPVNED